MKSILRFTPVAFTVLLLASCSRKKEVIVPPNPIAGSWMLVQALEGDSYGWQSFRTGLENGIFDFYGNGTAQYSEPHLSLQGNWYITNTWGPYYDEYGGYYNGNHQSFEMHLADNYTNSSIDLYFDNISVSGNLMVATYFNGSYIESYTFSRY